jgi:hypothetical protein
VRGPSCAGPTAARLGWGVVRGIAWVGAEPSYHKTSAAAPLHCSTVCSHRARSSSLRAGPSVRRSATTTTPMAERTHHLADLGVESLTHGKPEAAISYLSRALQRSERMDENATSRARHTLNLCVAFSEHGKPVDALEYAKLAIELLVRDDEADADQRHTLLGVAWFNACASLEKLGQRAEALRAARRGLAFVESQGADDPLVARLRRAERDLAARWSNDASVRLPALQSQQTGSAHPSPRLCYTPVRRTRTPGASFASRSSRGGFLQTQQTPGAGAWDDGKKILGGAITFRDPRDRFFEPVPDRLNKYMARTLGPGTYEAGASFNPQQLGTKRNAVDVIFGTAQRTPRVYPGREFERPDMLGACMLRTRPGDQDDASEWCRVAVHVCLLRSRDTWSCCLRGMRRLRGLEQVGRIFTSPARQRTAGYSDEYLVGVSRGGKPRESDRASVCRGGP